MKPTVPRLRHEMERIELDLRDQGRRQAEMVIILTFGGAMIQSHEPAILDLAVISLHDAIRCTSIRILEEPGALDVTDFRRVVRLMRIAIALAGVGSRLAPCGVP